ncbi:MAG: ribonuclease R [Rikenellaceae bacterium]
MSKKIKNRGYSKDEIASAVKNLFVSNPLSRLKARQIHVLLDVNQRRDKYLIKEEIDSLIENGFVDEVADGVYSLSKNSVNSIDAVVVQVNRGAIYVKSENIDEDIYIESNNAKNALVGDKIKIVISDGRNQKGRIEAYVAEVIERSSKNYVGIISLTRHFGFVEVDSTKMPYDILIPSEFLNGAKDRQKVMVEIVEWPNGNKNPTGMVTKVFGAAGVHSTEMHAILAEYNLEPEFKKSLEKQAAAISEKITKREIESRRDMRGISTFTIDPDDAKDFDDALSFQKLKNGNYEIGVHIADVTHYIKEGSDLDKEAFERATSVYLVDRVIPMLPEKLSNGLCSLRPNEDKLCFSVVFELNDEAEVLGSWFGRTIIHSNNRFTYKDAQDIIEGGEGPMKEEILTLDKIAKVLRKLRYKNGAIAFERDEAKFVLDDKGNPTGVYFKEMKDSNHLIEEYMLLANLSVAELIGKRAGAKRTFVYRIHDKPDVEKFDRFSEFVARFGYVMRAKSDRAIGKEINKLLNDIKGSKQETLFSTIALRTMAKARYSTSNIGHYGLAFKYYSHFTSPIRRYPDMMAHRLLQHYLDGGKSVNKDYYEELCKHCSQKEIVAAEAERSSVKYKMVEFLSDKIGEEFAGYISGVTEWGVYVELDETKIEGMVSVRSIKDDFYQFDQNNYRMVGMRYRRILTLGDKVIVKVVKADLRQKQLDYELVGVVDFETGKVKRIEDNGHVKSRTKLSKKRGRR